MELIQKRVLKILIVATLLVFPFLSFPQALPSPAGKYHTGTRIFHITDPARYDTLFKINRTISVQLWYPAVNTRGGQLMDYIPEKKLASYIIDSNYYNVDSSILSSFSTLKTNSYANAPLNREQGRFPVLLFTPGMGVLRANYTSLFENLASNGIIVASIDHMYEGSAILPDGRIADINAYPDTVYNNLYSDCIKDVSLIITAILNATSEMGAFLKNHIDTGRICESGHSSGGNIAMCSSVEDRRICCSINLDGGDFLCLGSNLTKPCLLVLEQPDYSDAELIKKGRDVKKWRADSISGLKPFMSVLQASFAKSFLVKIHQTGHMSFTDAPYLMPKLLTMFLGTYLSPDENLAIICGLIKDFIFNIHTSPGNLTGKLGSYKGIRLWSFNP